MAPLLSAARPKGILVDTHIHLFDPQKFAYHPNATYRPPAQTLDSYARFVREAKIDHAIIVHPEPYQDDHRYLEYCFLHEPFKGFFKGTCLFDPVAPETPARMEALVKRLPGRIVALRIHENQNPNKPPTTSGAIRDRDMRSPATLAAWRKAHSLGLAIQMHFVPCYAPQIRVLASELQEMPVILDHLGRYGEGTPAEFEEVLKLAELPRVYMKYSAVRYSSKQDYPHRDARPFVRRLFQAFGAERIIWGGLGMDRTEFDKQAALLDEMFDFAGETERANIRGLNATRLFGFSA
jgi:predicted TIM-barrel fold metal-dependent hydrolase